MTSLTGEERACEWPPASPAVRDAANKAHLSFSPSRELNPKLLDWRWEAAGRAADRTPCRALKVVDPTNCFADAIKKLARSCWGHSANRSPHLAQGQPQCSARLPHRLPHSGWYPVHAPSGGGESELWQVPVSRVREPA